MTLENLFSDLQFLNCHWHLLKSCDEIVLWSKQVKMLLKMLTQSIFQRFSTPRSFSSHHPLFLWAIKAFLRLDNIVFSAVCVYLLEKAFKLSYSSFKQIYLRQFVIVFRKSVSHFLSSQLCFFVSLTNNRNIFYCRFPIRKKAFVAIKNVQ